MICAVINGPTFVQAHQQIAQVLHDADLIELRLDLFTSWSIEELKLLRSSFSIPMIFTLRSQAQGGGFFASEERRLSLLLKIAELQPEYLDIEFDVPDPLFNTLISEFPTIKIILSYHNFIETPVDLDCLLTQMKKRSSDFYKIAVTAQNTLDCLRFIHWAKVLNQGLLAVSMGPYGQISRILAPLMGCPFTYACVDQPCVSGQLSARLLVSRFNYRLLTPETSIYALIGDPVEQSISDVTHNQFFLRNKINALYIKMRVKALEVPSLLSWIAQLLFQGVSVTMPLKEVILPHLWLIDEISKEIGAVNTLAFEQGQWAGHNTDASGALDAIEKSLSVRGKKIVILGSGGAARAIAYEASQRGAELIICARNEHSALQIADRFGGRALSIERMNGCEVPGLDYDVLINCTPEEMPIASQSILSNTMIMDIKTKPKHTLLMREAVEKKCLPVYGFEMFVGQALGQFSLWFGGAFSSYEKGFLFDACARESDAT